MMVNMKLIAIPLCLSLIYQSNGLGGTRLLGGVQEVNDFDERKTFANKALEQLEKASNNINARKIVEIVKVEKQIVSGISYTVTMKLAVTECQKGVNVEELTGCKENTDHKRQLCQIKIWEQPWKDFLEIQKLECGPENNDEMSVTPEDEDALPLLGKISYGAASLAFCGFSEAASVKYDGHLLGMDGHDEKPHGYKHNLHLQLPRNHKMLMKQHHMISSPKVEVHLRLLVSRSFHHYFLGRIPTFVSLGSLSMAVPKF
jgi:hypothetical protein